jgi:hypothetical protein
MSSGESYDEPLGLAVAAAALVSAAALSAALVSAALALVLVPAAQCHFYW